MTYLTAQDIATELRVQGATSPFDVVDADLDRVEMVVAKTRTAVDYQRRHGLALPGFVYFAMLDEGSVKIGYSIRPVSRFLDHSRSGLLLKPLLVIPAAPSLERELHRHFRHYGGSYWEVFQNTIALMSFIRWLREGLSL